MCVSSFCTSKLSLVICQRNVVLGFEDGVLGRVLGLALPPVYLYSSPVPVFCKDDEKVVKARDTIGEGGEGQRL